jgi:hypothetical protein
MLQIPNKLQIKQKIELLEVIFDFETSNRYEINHPGGKRFLFAYETCGFLWKFILPARRPCEIHMVDDHKTEHLLLRRNFFWFFPSYDLYADGQHLGHIQRNFAFLHTKYTLTSQAGDKLAVLEGPIWRPWTFNIKDTDGQKIGLIGKKMSGLKELFTDSDNFSFELDDRVDDVSLRALVLASAFAVDYDNFDVPAQPDKKN